MAEFLGANASILHYLGIMPCVDYHANNPLSVLEYGSSQQEVIVVQVDDVCVNLLIGRAKGTESSLKSVEHVIGGVTNYVSSQLAQHARWKRL